LRIDNLRKVTTKKYVAFFIFINMEFNCVRRYDLNKIVKYIYFCVDWEGKIFLNVRIDLNC